MAAAPAHGSIDAVFNAFSEALEKDGEARERVKEAVNKVTVLSRSIDYALQRVHSLTADRAATEAVLAEVGAKMAAELPQAWRHVFEQFEGEPAEKYSGMWRQTAASLAGTAALAHYLQTGALLTHEACGAAVGMGEALDLETYLTGVSGLPKELARLAVNAVTAGNYAMPGEAARFVADLYSGFRLLNLRNGDLRRRYDAIKYALERLEQIKYDVQIRKLQQQQE